MGVGSTQGYIGKECKKESSEEGGDEGEEGEKEVKGMRDVFFRVKQENLHVEEGFHKGNGVWCRRSRRWRVR